MKSPPDRVGLMVSIPSPGHWIAEIPDSLDIPGFLGIYKYIYIYICLHIYKYTIMVVYTSIQYTVPKINSSHLPGSPSQKERMVFQASIFGCENVSFSEGNPSGKENEYVASQEWAWKTPSWRVLRGILYTISSWLLVGIFQYNSTVVSSEIRKKIKHLLDVC